MEFYLVSILISGLLFGFSLAIGGWVGTSLFVYVMEKIRLKFNM